MSKRSIRKRRHLLGHGHTIGMYAMDASFADEMARVSEAVKRDALVYGTGVARVTKDDVAHVPFEEAQQLRLTPSAEVSREAPLTLYPESRSGGRAPPTRVEYVDGKRVDVYEYSRDGGGGVMKSGESKYREDGYCWGECDTCERTRWVIVLCSPYGPGSFSTCYDCQRERAEPIGLATDPNYRRYKMRTYYRGSYVDSDTIDGHIIDQEGRTLVKDKGHSQGEDK